jgi:hypothetical protein
MASEILGDSGTIGNEIWGKVARQWAGYSYVEEQPVRPQLLADIGETASYAEDIEGGPATYTEGLEREQ